jgi:sulfatase modifying factor 1
MDRPTRSFSPAPWPKFAVGLIGLSALGAAWPQMSASVPTPKAKLTPEVWVNSIGMPFVRIPAGQFNMGIKEPLEQLARSYPDYAAKRLLDLDDERPQHRVHLTRDFYLGQHLVTVGDFARFVKESGHVPESIRDGTGGYGYNPDYDPSKTERHDAFEGRNPKYSWQNPGFKQDDRHPVLNITWNDAQAMAAWLSAKEHAHYRLPTESEWEYACRAGRDTRYPHGNDPAGLPEVANTFDADAAVNWPRFAEQALKGHDGFAFTSPVGSFAPNGFGLYDMVGNAWQWTADWYGEDYYAHSPKRDPQGPAEGHVKVRRGGSWHTWALYARCTYRNWNATDTRYTLVGMRLVKEIEAPVKASGAP